MRHSQLKRNTAHISPDQGGEGTMLCGLRALPASGEALVLHGDGDGSGMCRQLRLRLSEKENLQPMQEAVTPQVLEP